MAITLQNLIHTYINNTAFSIIRLGNVETNALLNHPDDIPSDMMTNAGFYGDINTYKEWKREYTMAILNSDIYLDVVTCPSFAICGQLLMRLNVWKPTLPYMELDFGFYKKLVEEITKVDNRITIVSYFIEDMKRQLENITHIHPWMASIKWTFVKSHNTIQGNNKHKSWSETFIDLKKRVDRTEAKYVFLSCGCYGLPLCNYLKSQGRNPLYIGGFLQLLFGLKGKRWEERQEITKEYNKYWKYPSIKPMNSEKVENWCYGE